MDNSGAEIVAAINSGRQGTVLDVLDITVVEVERERVVATMPIGPNHRQNLGYLHGGVSITLAESVASLASALIIDQKRQICFGQEINASHLRPKREGQVTAVATPLRLGRSAHVWDVRITDEADKLICVSRCTIAIVDRPSENGDLFQRQSGGHE